MYPTHLMGTVQSGKREAQVKMKRPMSLVTKQLEETQSDEDKNWRERERGGKKGTCGS